MTNHTDHNRKSRQKRKAAGLCSWCNRPRVNATLCEHHRAIARQYSAALSKKNKKRRHDAGLCLHCDKPRINATHCEYHRELARATIRKSCAKIRARKKQEQQLNQGEK